MHSVGAGEAERSVGCGRSGAWRSGGERPCESEWWAEGRGEVEEGQAEGRSPEREEIPLRENSGLRGGAKWRRAGRGEEPRGEGAP